LEGGEEEKRSFQRFDTDSERKEMPSRIGHRLLVSFVVMSLFLMSFVSSYAETTNYIYDALNRLIQVEYGNGSVVEYTYDKAGNRLEKTIQVVDTTPPTTAASPAGGVFTALLSP
jgi:YD repeat-containing protein